MTSIVASDETGRVLARELAATLPAGGVPCVVGACGREDGEAFEQIAAECDAAGTPFFVVELGISKLRLSPVYGSLYGSCYHCRAEAIRAERGPFDHAEPVPAGWLPQHLAFAALAVGEVIERLQQPERLFKTHRTLDLFDSTLSSTRAEGMPHA